MRAREEMGKSHAFREGKVKEEGPKGDDKRSRDM